MKAITAPPAMGKACFSIPRDLAYGTVDSLSHRARDLMKHLSQEMLGFLLVTYPEKFSREIGRTVTFLLRPLFATD
jgi:hypothetical protein